tara:strand:- start:600 stop:806 length:207 start_codon:yes stop_codon:yes gene_type:complete
MDNQDNQFEMYDFLMGGMSRKEHKALSQVLEAAAERASRDPEFARHILMQTGLYNPNGTLKDDVPYQK